ncbi:MAG: RnfABCDGE type electron transport complex subunit G [Lachnospira sp.]
MGKIIKDALILFAITIVAGILLGVVYDVTLDPIAKANEDAKNKAYQAVLSDADTFEDLKELPSDSDLDEANDEDFSKDVLNSVAVGKKDGNTVGYVVTVTGKDGYGGDIKLTVGISSEGEVKGISFLSLSETAGLGMRAKNADFKDQFNDKKVEQFKVVTDGSGADSDSSIDAIGGSTITSKAVTKAVNYALAAYSNITNQGGAK